MGWLPVPWPKPEQQDNQLSIIPDGGLPDEPGLPAP